MMAHTMPMIASGVQASLSRGRGEAVGARGVVVGVVDIVDGFGVCCCFWGMRTNVFAGVCRMSMLLLFELLESGARV